MKKRLLSLLLAICLCTTLLSTTALATSKTADDAINWAKSQVGHSVGYDDGSGYYQCVEFIQAYYRWLGVDAVAGNGCDYATNALPSGWTRTAGGVPQKGDILVYSRYSSTVQQYGHVAIYESDSVLYDQDGSVYGATVKKENKNYRTYTYNYWGCIHPNFTASVSTSVTFSNWENNNYTYIYETDASIGQQIDVSGGTCTKTGMILYDNNRNLLGKAENPTYTDHRVFFMINEELGVTLKPGTTYQYRFYAVVGGKTYYSDYKSFTTTGHSHNYTAKITAPTCTKQGYTTYTCSCGDSYKSNYVAALGHNYIDGKCTRCGAADPDYKPVPVVTISTVASTGKPKLAWNAVDGASKYEVYRATSKNGTYSKMYTTSGTSYTNTTATAGKIYYYKVKAISKNGVGSDFSEMHYITCDCAQPVVSITTVASTGKPKLTWNAVDGATKYEIYRATSKNGTYTKMYTTTNTSYTNSTSTAGKLYYYKVKAICGASSSGNSALSEVHYMTCDCAQPTVSITTSNGHPKLTWKAVDGATKYEIYRATSKTGTYSKMYTTSNTSYTNTTAVTGTTYYYKVKAICGASSAGNSAYSTVVSIKAK